MYYVSDACNSYGYGFSFGLDVFKSLAWHSVLLTVVYFLCSSALLFTPCFASWAASPGWAGFLTHLKGCFWHLAMMPMAPTPHGSRRAGEKKTKKKAGDLAIGVLPSATAALLAAEGPLVWGQCQELHPPPARSLRWHDEHGRGGKSSDWLWGFSNKKEKCN